MSQFLSLRFIAAALVSGVVTWMCIEQIAVPPRWPWMGLFLGTIVFGIPLASGLGRLIEGPDASSEPPADLRDVVTFWIVCAIMFAGWVTINLK